ncbi:MAG: glycosyltransferase [Geminicoccaceae bacterium]
MKVAVVTPYYRTPLEWLHQCHASVRAQSHVCTHIMVADGEPLDTVDKFDALHIKSIGPNDDVGNTARGIGSIAAIRQGFDAVCYLDADNWYQPDHVAGMIRLHKESRAAICASARTLHHVDGTKLGLCFENDGEAFVDTNCMFLTKEAFPIVSVWHTVDRRLDPIGDRVIWFQIKQLGLTTAYSNEPTVCYRTNYREHYQHFNATPPPGAKTGYDHFKSRKLFEDLKAAALRQQGGDSSAAGIGRPITSDDGMLPSFRQHRHLLISLIGLPRPQLDRILDGLVEDCVADGKSPVFITDEADLAVTLSQKHLVEHLPSPRSRDAFAPDLDWDLYLDRRLRQIREKWHAHHVVALGLPIDAIIKRSSNVPDTELNAGSTISAA